MCIRDRFITYFLLENSKALEFYKELIGNLIPEPPEETWVVKLYLRKSECSAEVFLRDDECVDEYGPTPRQAILNAMEKIND